MISTGFKEGYVTRVAGQFLGGLGRGFAELGCVFAKQGD